MKILLRRASTYLITSIGLLLSGWLLVGIFSVIAAATEITRTDLVGWIALGLILVLLGVASAIKAVAILEKE